MKIDVITLFPNMFSEVLGTSMLKKATDNGLAEFNIVDLREYGLGPRRQVDDTPYGGGDGMVLKPEPIFKAVEKLKTKNSKVIFLSPAGETYKQSKAQELSKEKHLILVCGRYEGFDERVFSLADYTISIGNYVLTGGEIPAMVVVDSVVRLIPGVLGGETSATEESFSDDKSIEYPHYTRPEEFRDMRVPDVLLSGNHGEIEEWRKQQSQKRSLQ